MFYKKCELNKNSKKRAFSLVEVLMTLTVLSIIIAVFAPMITRKISEKTTRDGIVYTYSSSNNVTANNLCFALSMDNITNQDLENTGIADIGRITPASSTECSQYTFTVPEGVTKVNLTLVAGGGGGGGAAGGYEFDWSEQQVLTLNGTTGSNDYTLTASDSTDASLFKKLIIRALTGYGQPIASSYIYPNTNGKLTQGDGGLPSAAIINKEIGRDIIFPDPLESTSLRSTSLVNRTSKISSASAYNFYYTIGYKNSAKTKLTDSYDMIKNNPLGIRFVYNGTSSTSETSTTYPTYGTMFYTDGSICEKPSTGNCSTATTPVSCCFNNLIDDGTTLITTRERTGNLEEYAPSTSIYPYKAYGELVSGFGSGESRYTVCEDYGSGNIECTDKESSCDKVSDIRSGNCTAGQGYADYSLITEQPGGTGGGGSGGGAVRVIGFNVTPGQTYLIVVGKGGKGGNAGLNGYTNIESSSDNGSSGSNGKGGVSTAIYLKDGNNLTLQYIVLGGAGGIGGRILNFDDADGYYNDDDFHAPYAFATNVNNVRNIRNGASVGYLSYIGTTNDDTSILTNANLDSKFAALGNTDSNDIRFCNRLNETTGACNNTTNIYLKSANYSAFDDGGVLNFMAESQGRVNSGYLKGFSMFTARSANANNAVATGNISIGGNSYARVYDGLYYRSIVKNAPAYIGGLGGFSGLNSKAGCGGFFMGNFGGYEARNSSTNTFSNDNKNLFKNKFIVNNTLYDVSTFYDNCTLDTPNGQSANFVMPDAKSQTFGQAGSGGGGGGYSMVLGAGKGGDGQNGYLMIDWSK